MFFDGLGGFGKVVDYFSLCLHDFVWFLMYSVLLLALHLLHYSIDRGALGDSRSIESIEA